VNIFLTTELVVGTLSTLGAILLILKRTGYVTFGKPAERRDCARKCAEHEQVVADAKVAVSRHEMMARVFTESLAELKVSVSDLRKEVHQSEVSTQVEFRKLNNLIGYVKGIHGRDE
jgi:hypothetical protein